ncbi:nucleotidyltransferase family protein [Plebeiibacterium sediminum]|uniref:Nucleotidyltransferase family protein n=1 Tax=Plebeiibacterium sediminum TaxID=2992112 RepID=A0AAE3M9S3_9BACT|nr:nucleotidyltransferase family protein [Plebeiobacterium sediminum]MCW3789205.1 nucleotidyltransferase family protein [Plebeiobacterium sediminum]
MGIKSKIDQLAPEEQWVLQTVLHSEVSKIPLPHNLEYSHTFALKNGLAPYLFKQLNHSKSIRTNELIASLKKDYLTSFIRNTIHLTVWEEVKTLFKEHHLSPIPLKGLVLATQVYTDPALRPMSDLDILFLEDQAQTAFDLLLKYGGSSHQQEAGHDKKTGHQLPGLTYKGVLIEIHRTLFDTDIQYNIPNVYLKDFLFQKKGITTFTPEINFIYFCLHAYHTMRRGGIRISWFLDLILLSQKEHLNTEILIKHLNALALLEPIQLITSQTEFLFRYAFDFIPDHFKRVLTEKEQNDLIRLIHHSDQQNTDFSYSIALERLKNTKGIKNKMSFLRSVLSSDKDGNKNIITRTMSLIYKLSKYYLNKLKS